MTCSVSELLELIKRTIAQATPEEKRQLREALCENTCEICGRQRITLLFNTVSGRLNCFQCLGHANADPAFVREPGDYTAEDLDFLRAIGVSWR